MYGVRQLDDIIIRVHESSAMILSAVFKRAAKWLAALGPTVASTALTCWL